MDKLIRGTAHSGDIRIIAAETTSLVNEAIKNHNAFPTAAAAYGRMLTAASLMGSTLKDEKESITLQINGKGISGGILAIGKTKGKVKGYIVNPEADIPLNEKGKLDVSGIVGRDGDFTVIKDYGLKEPYVSSVPIYTGEIAEDLAYYFTVSEQTPSAVALGVLVDKDGTIKKSGGFIIQMLPGANDMVADLLMYRLEEMESITNQLEKGLSIVEIIEDLFIDMDLNIMEEEHPSLYCDCSRETVTRALLSIGKEDLREIREDGKDENLVCHFCNKNYTFTKEDISELLESLE